MKRTTIVALFFAGLLTACSPPEHTQKTAAGKSGENRLQIAEKMFQERCKKSGEFIHRTAENVDGVLLMKLRPQSQNFADQFAMDDPYGHDIGGDGYITNFLHGRNASGSLVEQDAIANGYRYVEVIDSMDGKRYRYTGSIKEVSHTSSILIGGDGKTTFKTKDFVLDKTPASDPAPRYGVTYDDISTREEREYWIAGGSLKIVDLQTNEVIAERVGYMMDRGQGSTSGGRSPWLLAARHACPSFPVAPGGNPFKMDQTRNFVETVLHIKQTNKDL